jgi:peptidoglycan hydrolase-like protein with peptidoglycan-binding domain
VNGTYDTATKNAVESFQDANQGTSPPDPYGVYGPATDKAMQQAMG